ncbi:thymocyte expressed, positive selection associated 1, partial [Chelydra serpentina]
REQERLRALGMGEVLGAGNGSSVGCWEQEWLWALGTGKVLGAEEQERFWALGAPGRHGFLAGCRSLTPAVPCQQRPQEVWLSSDMDTLTDCWFLSGSWLCPESPVALRTMEAASVLSPSSWEKRRAWVRQSRCWRTTVLEEEAAVAVQDVSGLQTPHLDDVFLEGSSSSKIETWLQDCG